MGLMVRFGPFEPRQKAVVDIDAAPGKVSGQVLGQDLHVAGEHDEVRGRFLHHGLDLGFLPGPGFLADRQVVERDVIVERKPQRLAGMVGHHADHLHAEFADATAIQKIVQAMIEFRHKQQDAWLGVGRPQAPDHVLIARHLAERLLKGGAVLVGVEQHAHEKQAGFPVVELLGVHDIAAIVKQGPADRGDQAGPVRASQRKDVRRCH
jgi:hypothetical protein